MKLCSKCHINKAVKVRKLDKKKLPSEYFHPPDETISLMLKFHKMDSSNTDYWIHLPPEMILSKYDYYLCHTCVSTEANYEWNYWMLI